MRQRSVYGKILSIQKATGTITYTYDASGNRITKTYNGKTTWYVRDATGNVMSIYETDATLNSGHLTQTEVHLYGSSRLGIFRINRDVNSITKADYTVAINTFTRGNKFFELSNHLGNVLATISDRKVMQLPDNDGCTPGSGKPTLELDYHTYEDEIVATQAITLLPGFETWDNETHTIYINETLGVCPPTDPANPPAASFYRADVISANDYYPFGMTMPGRNFSAGTAYRFGFGGKEKDNSTGEGNLDFGSRILDVRLGGRWLSADPKASKFPYESPYVYVSNNPLIYIDPDGEEKIIVVGGGDNSTIRDRNKFINTGLLQARNYANAIQKGNSGEAVTILLNMKFVSKAQQGAMRKAMKTIEKETGVKINMVGTFDGQSTTNYINSKTPEKGILSDARTADQITDMSFFGHGYASNNSKNGFSKYDPAKKALVTESVSSFEPAHSTSGEEWNGDGVEHQKWSWGVIQAQSINSNAFATDSKIDFYSCNTAASNSSGDNLAKYLSALLPPSTTVSGASGLTSYDFIYEGRTLMEKILNWRKDPSKAGGTQAVGEAKQLPVPTKQTGVSEWHTYKNGQKQ